MVAGMPVHMLRMDMCVDHAGRHRAIAEVNHFRTLRCDDLFAHLANQIILDQNFHLVLQCVVDTIVQFSTFDQRKSHSHFLPFFYF